MTKPAWYWHIPASPYASSSACPSRLISKTWHAAVTRAGLPREITYHSLRHYYASLLIRHGESIKTVQRLGHSSAVTTLNTYSHLWPDSDDRTRAAVDEVLRTAADYVRTNRGAEE
jgi:integrase